MATSRATRSMWRSPSCLRSSTLPRLACSGVGLCALGLLLDLLTRLLQLAHSCRHSLSELSSMRREVWSIAKPSARVPLLALSLVQPHPPPRLHQRSLRRVRCLQAVPEGGVLEAGEPVGNVCLQGASSPISTERSR